MGIASRALLMVLVAAAAAIGGRIVLQGGCGNLPTITCVELVVREATSASPNRATWHGYPAVVLSPLFDDVSSAETLLNIAYKYGAEKGFGLYTNSAQNDGERFPNVPQRLDAAVNYMRTGGPKGRKEVYSKARARTNYFRETYAYHGDVRIDNAGLLLNHPALVESAQTIYPGKCNVVRPSLVYANLMVPGQELAIHTDVPAFRGVTRTTAPEWLMVVMLHSGLFDDYRLRIATGVSWWHTPENGGGSFVYWPEGPNGESKSHSVAYNTAVVVDTDSVFHGVEQVDAAVGDIPVVRPGNRLHYVPEQERWEIRDGDTAISSYPKNRVRLSVSWKAYCFKDEAEEAKWKDHTDDLTVDEVLDVLVADMQRRGRIGAKPPTGVDLAAVLMNDYIQFPPASSWLANYCLVKPFNGLLCGNFSDVPPDFRKGYDQTKE